MIDAIRNLPTDQLGYEHAWGIPRFRDVVSAHLRLTRGVDVTPDQVVATSGVVQGEQLAVRALGAIGYELLAFEDPLQAKQRELLGSGGLQLVPVPVDREGVVVEQLASSGARAVFVTAAHQYPTGVTMSGQRRRDLVAWAERVDALIIEDDYAAEFQPPEDRLPALQHDSPDRVTYLGTVSKTLAPGLRLGWAIPALALRDSFRTLQAQADHGQNVFDQHAFATLVERGAYGRHVRKRRSAYRKARALAVDLLSSRDGWSVDGGAGGLHLWVAFPPDMSDSQLTEAAAEDGVLVSAGSGMTQRDLGPHIAVSFGATSEVSLQEGIRRLFTAADRVSGGRLLRPSFR